MALRQTFAGAVPHLFYGSSLGHYGSHSKVSKSGQHQGYFLSAPPPPPIALGNSGPFCQRVLNSGEFKKAPKKNMCRNSVCWVHLKDYYSSDHEMSMESHRQKIQTCEGSRERRISIWYAADGLSLFGMSDFAIGSFSAALHAISFHQEFLCMHCLKALDGKKSFIFSQGPWADGNNSKCHPNLSTRACLSAGEAGTK